MATTFDQKQLTELARSIRKRFLRMHFEAKAGHVGTGLSSIEILAYLYKSWLKPSDRFILSKGHGASSLYATLGTLGVFSEDLMKTYYKDATTLPAHPAARAHEEIPAATGSLGHGLPIATGMAYAALKLKKDGTRVAALLSDGECNEGSTWEAALFAGHHKLTNLLAMVDANGLQGFGRTEEVLDLEPFAKKWEAFGWEVRDVDGHDLAAIHGAVSSSEPAALGSGSSKPRVILCRTKKGKGVKAIEDTLASHYLPLTQEQYDAAMKELES